MDNTLSLLGPLAGAGIAVVVSYLTNRWTSQRLHQQWAHEATKEKSNLLRSRGEELYAFLHHWLNALGNNYLGITSVMQGKLAYNEHLDMVIKSGVSEKFDAGRMELIVQAYFPSLRQEYGSVMNARTQLNRIALEHKRAYQRGDIDGQRFVSPFVAAQKAVEAAGEVLKQKLLQELRSI
jgi:hypothetical protein